MIGLDHQQLPAEIFAQARLATGAGRFDDAIDLYLSGLEIAPDHVEAHRALRQVSLQRKATGGKNLGVLDGFNMRWTWRRSHRQNLLNAERLLAYDPGNMDNMLRVYQTARRGGFFETAKWIGEVLRNANLDLGRLMPS